MLVLSLVLGTFACSETDALTRPEAGASIPQKRLVARPAPEEGQRDAGARSPLPALRRPEKAPATPDASTATAAPVGPPPEIARPYDPSADARADIAAALVRARRTKTRVLLVFGGNWCPWCRRLAYTFENHPEVSRKLAEGFQVVRVDATGEHNDALVARYGSPTKNGVPVLVVLDDDGEVLYTQATGPFEKGDRHDPAKIVAFLEAARE